MSCGVTLDTLQDKQTLDDFVEAKRGGICGIICDRYINNGNGNVNGNNNSNGNDNGNQGTCFADGNDNDNDNGKTIWLHRRKQPIRLCNAEKLPYKDFKYSDTSKDVILNTPDDSDHGYYIVCDINYTNSCKQITEQLAIMPHKRQVNDNELGYRKRDGGKARSENIILDQNNKTEYMVHYRMLKFYVKMCVKVTKTHSVIQFKQDYICRDYIHYNTNKRATAKTEAEKDVRKLLNNPLYERMCMNPLHFLQSKFLHDEEKIMKSISKSTFKNTNRYRDYSQIEYIKKKIEYDSPVYVGVTILELSKLHMYDVFYNILQPSLKDLQLFYMDTDSLY